MPIHKIEEIGPNLPQGGRLLGLDLGTKTIGLAVSDAALSIASPIGTIRRQSFERDVADLTKAMEGRSITALILGFPINMDGTIGPRAEATQRFADQLAEQIDQPIALWDERLSTKAVERAMIDADMTRKKRAKKVDTAAAAFILQGAIDFIRTGGLLSPGL